MEEFCNIHGLSKLFIDLSGLKTHTGCAKINVGLLKSLDPIVVSVHHFARSEGSLLEDQCAPGKCFQVIFNFRIKCEAAQMRGKTQGRQAINATVA